MMWTRRDERMTTPMPLSAATTSDSRGRGNAGDDASTPAIQTRSGGKRRWGAKGGCGRHPQGAQGGGEGAKRRSSGSSELTGDPRQCEKSRRSRAAPTALSEVDLSGDFDPETWDKRMEEIFNDDYYNGDLKTSARPRMNWTSAPPT